MVERPQCTVYEHIGRCVSKVVQLEPKDVKPLRDKLLTEQNGICLICNKPVKSPVLDHSHKKKNKGTGLVRGVLCSGCNVLLGKNENNCVRCGVKNTELPYILHKMSVYLQKEHLPYIHPSEKERVMLNRADFKELVKFIEVHYPKRKVPKYPKNGILSSNLEKVWNEFKGTSTCKECGMSNQQHKMSCSQRYKEK